MSLAIVGTSNLRATKAWPIMQVVDDTGTGLTSNISAYSEATDVKIEIPKSVIDGLLGSFTIQNNGIPLLANGTAVAGGDANGAGSTLSIERSVLATLDNAAFFIGTNIASNPVANSITDFYNKITNLFTDGGTASNIFLEETFLNDAASSTALTGATLKSLITGANSNGSLTVTNIYERFVDIVDQQYNPSGLTDVNGNPRDRQLTDLFRPNDELVFQTTYDATTDPRYSGGLVITVEIPIATTNMSNSANTINDAAIPGLVASSDGGNTIKLHSVYGSRLFLKVTDA